MKLRIKITALAFMIITNFAFIAYCQNDDYWYKYTDVYNNLEVATGKSNEVYQLSLYNRNLTQLPNDLCSLIELRTLVLSFNKISNLNSDCFYNNLKHLTEFDLSDNLIDSLPEEFCLLFELEDLNLGANKISDLPACFIKLKNIKSINLSENKIYNFPNELLEFENIESIFLFNNNISILPKEIEKFKKIRLLDIANNNINHIPEEIFNLTSLRQLVLEGNPIDSSIIIKLKEKLIDCEVIF